MSQKSTTHKGRQTGRPTLPLGVARRKRVVTMVTDSEFQRLQDWADEGNRSVSRFVHDILRQFLAKQPKTC